MVQRPQSSGTDCGGVIGNGGGSTSIESRASSSSSISSGSTGHSPLQPTSTSPSTSTVGRRQLPPLKSEPSLAAQATGGQLPPHVLDEMQIRFENNSVLNGSQSAAQARQHQLECENCPICSDRVSGYHYGLLTCESCKVSFLSRHTTPKLPLAPVWSSFLKYFPKLNLPQLHTNQQGHQLTIHKQLFLTFISL